MWGWLREQSIKRPKWVAERVGIEQIGYLQELKEPKPSPTLTEVGHPSVSPSPISLLDGCVQIAGEGAGRGRRAGCEGVGEAALGGLRGPGRQGPVGIGGSRSRPIREADVLVCDIGMPGEDGYSLIKWVRALGPGQGGEVPSIVLTAYARGEDRVKAVLAGFQIHLAKAVEPAELIATLASLAGRTR